MLQLLSGIVICTGISGTLYAQEFEDYGGQYNGTEEIVETGETVETGEQEIDYALEYAQSQADYLESQASELVEPEIDYIAEFIDSYQADSDGITEYTDTNDASYWEQMWVEIFEIFGV